jgi:hypothetical protein
MFASCGIGFVLQQKLTQAVSRVKAVPSALIAAYLQVLAYAAGFMTSVTLALRSALQ